MVIPALATEIVYSGYRYHTTTKTKTKPNREEEEEEQEKRFRDYFEAMHGVTKTPNEQRAVNNIPKQNAPAVP